MVQPEPVLWAWQAGLTSSMRSAHHGRPDNNLWLAPESRAGYLPLD